MTHHRRLPVFLIPISCLVATVAIAQVAPEKALKYHEALLKRPHNAALFDRFFGAWLDEQAVETLEAFLNARALANGGQEWTVLATYELRRGKEDEALVALGKGIDALPDDPALPMERAKLRVRRLEFDGARTDLAQVAAGKDEALALEAAKLTGKSWLREGKTEEAIKAWDGVLAAHPGDEDLLEDLVETAAAESETAQALVYADKLIAASRDPYQKTLRMLRRGDLLAQAGRHDEAVEAYAAIFNQVGEGSWLEREVLAQIEKVFRKQDRLDDLSAQLKKLAEAYPQRLLIHRQLAKLEAAQGEADAAIGRFREVLKRSPGDKELREEFVRLLSDGERFDDAAAELEKLIELSPADSGLYLQVAAMRFRQGKPELVLAALNKAHELLGTDEGNGIRIAGLMLQYQLKDPGEALLKEIGSAAGAGPLAMEALAAQYGRTDRKPEAVELLKKAAAGDDVDVLLRNAGAISALGESGVAFETLTARTDKFSADPRFLAALAQSALAAAKPAEAVPQVIKLVRMAKQTTELAESINLASRVITGADKVDEIRTALAAQPTRSTTETCLLASLIEDSGDFVAVGQLLDANTDTLVLHFYAALLDRRGEFDTAIAVISRLADTEEGKKAAYFKDLAELQQRAGKIPEALATVERWKLSAPGDKTAWITGSRLLRESGKPEDAVKMTRQAVARFEGDTDLAASLASLHDEAGQWQDAEAIYWRLYDDSQSPADQARWAVQLAQLAQRMAKTEDLEEKLRERARSNRKSIGPILAMAELARVTNNEDKRRDLLLEAVRLQPKDLDLRLQIASLEDQSSNPERVVALLEEALPYDANGRVRSALAQAYLRQGQAVKGMRELRLLAGKTGFDPRSAESAAAALAGTKLYEEAIGFLRSELPDGGDWRSRYLLAVLLEEDGREAEAVPIFLSLLQAQGEIPKLVLPQATGNQNYYDQLPKEIRDMYRLVISNQAAYKTDDRSGMSYSMGQGATRVGAFYLPNTPEDVRQFALIHLCVLSKKPNGEGELILARVKAAGIDNAAFIADLASQRGGEGNMTNLLENYPEQPGLFDFVLSFGGYGQQGLDDKLVRRVLENAAKLSPTARFNAWAIIATKAKPEDPAWSKMLEAAQACIDDKTPESAEGVSYRLMFLLQGQQGTCPEIHRKAARELMLAAYNRAVKDEPKMAHNYYSLAMFALAENPDAWLGEINAIVRDSRKAPQQAGYGMGYRTRFGQLLQQISRSSSRGYNPWSSVGNLFEPPTFETLPVRSIPQQVISQFSPQAGYQENMKPLLTPVEMVKRGEQIESPYLRAWLAAKADDKAAITKAMAAVAPQDEACDFEMLRAVLAIQDKKLTDAFASLLKARAAAGSDREFSGAISMALIGLAGSMTPEERAGLAAEIQATFLQSRQIFGVLGAQVLAGQARKLGLEDLAKRIEPVNAPTVKGGKSSIAAAAIAGSSTSSSSSGSSSDRVEKLVADKKYEAAAREALQMIRALNNQNGASYQQYQLREVMERLGKEGQAEILKLVDPGESKSLVKRLEYADMCSAVGKGSQALGVLEVLAKERPDDAGIAARLAFTVPADQAERRLGLMTKACKDEQFVTQASAIAASLLEGNNGKLAMEFFETTTRWLETADPKVLADANLTWASYYAKDFFGGDSDLGLPSVLANGDGDDRDSNKALAEQHKALCGRLARALMRHASCAEEGFRLLAGSKAWKLDPAETDEWARQALLASVAPLKSGSWQSDQSQFFFTLVQGNGGSTSGNDLAESSSASWCAARLAEVKNPAEIFTPGFIADLTQRNPKVGEMLVSLSRKLNNEDLAGLWESDVMKSSSDRFSRMLRPLVLKRMATAPGASKFFVDKIAAIKPGEAVGRNGGVDNNLQPLFVAAITATATGKPGELDAVARAISKAVFGEKIEFSAATGQRDYQRVNLMDNLTDAFDHDALLMVRYQAAFFRIGVPVSQGEYGETEPFQNKHFAKAEEAEAFLESLGWLSDAERWEPYASVVYDARNSGNGTDISVKPMLLMDRVFQHMNNGTMKLDDLIARLKERKTGRFGSLMSAAALSSGKDRSALAGQAFTESAAALAKLPPERIESLAMLLPWLPDEVRAKLPESFRHKLLGVESKKRDEAIAAADKYITSLKSRGNGNNGSREASAVVASLIPYDLDKAVEVFVADEQAYTDSLARGGRYSNSSSGDWQCSQRDYTLYELVEDDGVGMAFQANPNLKLRFYKKLLASPSGKRLSWTVYYNSRTLFSTAFTPLMKAQKFAHETGDVVEMVETYQALEPELKAVALPCFVLTKLDINPTEDPKQRQAIVAKLAKLVANDPLAARLATVRLAQWSWKACTPEEKTEARTAITALFSDESIPDMARVMIAAELLTSLPKEDILDAATCTALAKLYQDYCAGERTAITQTSDALFKTLVKTPLRDEAAVALYKALAQSFWANTALPKAAGHPPVPGSLAQSTFIAAVLGNDAELVKTTFPRIKPLLSGKLVPMLALVGLGRADLARQLAPIPAAGFEVESNNSLTYDKALEESLAAFKQAGIDAPTLQKLEFELLDLPLGKKDNAPVEATDARTERLLASFMASAPHDSVVVTALRSLLRKAPTHPALLAAIDAWAKAHPPGDFLGRESNSDSFSRAHQAAIDLHGNSALRAFAAGDTSRLKLLQDAVAVPPENRNGNGGYQMSHDVVNLVRQMSRTIWNGVCLGNTAGYKDGLAAWNDFAIQCAGPISYDSSEIAGLLAASHFLACWAGDPAAFDKMCERLPEKTAEYGKKFNRQDGFTPFVKTLNLDALPESISSRKFVEKALSQPSLVGACPKTIAWVESLASRVQAEAISDLMANPPASLVPELLPALYGYRARYLHGQQPEQALVACRKALEICPDDAANKHLRGTLKRDLAELLSAAKQVDEAKKTLASLTPEEIPDEMRASYLELAKKLEVKPVISPLPPKKPEPSKED